ncbi:MAG: hypothetical protein WCH31_09945 [Actinomycetes bacterium]
MRRRLVAFLLVIGACVSGCGSSSSGVVEAAIEASPQTYFHYASPAWWGRAVTVQTVNLKVSGDTAEANVQVLAGTKLLWQEYVFVLHEKKGWVVQHVAMTAGGSRLIPFSGPVATRQPTAEERASLTHRVRTFLGQPASCLRIFPAISTVDTRYALVRLQLVGPHPDRCLNDGAILYRRVGGVWQYLGTATEPFDCRIAPTGVIRSLFGRCWIDLGRPG